MIMAKVMMTKKNQQQLRIRLYEDGRYVQTSFVDGNGHGRHWQRGVNNKKIIKQKRALKISAMLLTYL